MKELSRAQGGAGGSSLVLALQELLCPGPGIKYLK